MSNQKKEGAQEAMQKVGRFLSGMSCRILAHSSLGAF